MCFVNGRYKIVFSAAWTKQFSYDFIVKLWWSWLGLYVRCLVSSTYYHCDCVIRTSRPDQQTVLFWRNCVHTRKYIVSRLYHRVIEIFVFGPSCINRVAIDRRSTALIIMSTVGLLADTPGVESNLHVWMCTCVLCRNFCLRTEKMASKDDDKAYDTYCSPCMMDTSLYPSTRRTVGIFSFVIHLCLPSSQSCDSGKTTHTHVHIIHVSWKKTYSRKAWQYGSEGREEGQEGPKRRGKLPEGIACSQVFSGMYAISSKQHRLLVRPAGPYNTITVIIGGAN